MNKIVLLLRSLFTYIVVGIIIALILIPCFIISCFPARWRYENRVYYWLTNILFKATEFSTFLPVTIEGKEHLPQEPSIFVANHESALDIPFLGSLLNGAPHVWLFYVRYAKIPLLGWMLSRMNVVIDPSGLRKLVSSLDKTVAIIKDKKTHVMIFPEGGRYTDGIHKFFYGFAVIAKETKRPVVPVMMYNLGKAYPPRAFFIRSYPITLLIGKPFYFRDDETDEDFVKRVHAWFKNHEK